jgi:hypothetical protein
MKHPHLAPRQQTSPSDRKGRKMGHIYPMYSTAMTVQKGIMSIVKLPAIHMHGVALSNEIK